MYPKGSPFCYGSIGKQPHNPYITFGRPRDQHARHTIFLYCGTAGAHESGRTVAGPLSYKLLDQFTMPMLPTEPQCTNVIACIRYSNNMPVVTV